MRRRHSAMPCVHRTALTATTVAAELLIGQKKAVSPESQAETAGRTGEGESGTGGEEGGG